MAIVMGSATVPASTTGTFLFSVPPGWCNVTFYTLGTPVIYLGTATAPTTLGGTSPSGMSCHSIPTTITGYQGSKGASFYGATAGTSSTTYATSIQYIISTAQ
jgi:hypothetical protein